jgi:hypothetical protein
VQIKRFCNVFVWFLSCFISLITVTPLAFIRVNPFDLRSNFGETAHRRTWLAKANVDVDLGVVGVGGALIVDLVVGFKRACTA